MREGLRETPFHRAMHRSNLILGGERGWMIMVLMITGILTIVSMNIVAFIVGTIIGIGGVTALRAMAKADPLMSVVFFRSRKYKKYYPSYSRPCRVSKSREEY